MTTSHLELVRANHSRRTDIGGELREIDEAATTEQRAYTETEEGRITELRSELTAIDERIQANLEAEIRSQEIGDGIDRMFGALIDRQNGEVIDNRSLGQRLTSSDEFRSFAERGAQGNQYPSATVDMEFRAVTDVTTGTSSGGAFINPERLARMGHSFGDRRVYLLDLLPHIPVSGPVEYVKDTSPKADLADKAVEVTEAAAKPQAGPTLTVVTETPATIAAWVNITRQAAADVPQLTAYLDGRLRYSLKRRSDGQAINGDGSAPNLQGLANRSGINTYAPGSTEARYKSIRHGITLVEQDEFMPEIICLNPADAELFDLSNEASAGLHAMDADGGMANAGPRTAWGMTQVRSNAIAAGTALLIDPMAVAVFDRQQATAYMTDSHGTNFINNILTLLLECRVGLGLFDPEGVCKITFHD